MITRALSLGGLVFLLLCWTAVPTLAATRPPAPWVVPAGTTRVHGILAVGRSVQVEGTVRGDVFVLGGKLRLGPAARVRGTVGVVGGHLSLAQGAQIRGGTFQVDLSRLDFGDLAGMISALFLYDLLRAFLALGEVLVAGALGLFFPEFMSAVGMAIERRPGRAALAGVLAACLALLMFLLLALSMVGVPLALAVLGLAAVTTVVGQAGLSSLLGERMAIAMPGAPATSAGRMALGMALLQAASFLPVVGGMIFLASSFLGLGGLLFTARRPQAARG